MDSLAREALDEVPILIFDIRTFHHALFAVVRRSSRQTCQNGNVPVVPPTVFHLRFHLGSRTVCLREVSLQILIQFHTYLACDHADIESFWTSFKLGRGQDTTYTA